MVTCPSPSLDPISVTRPSLYLSYLFFGPSVRPLPTHQPGDRIEIRERKIADRARLADSSLIGPRALTAASQFDFGMHHLTPCPEDLPASRLGDTIQPVGQVPPPASGKPLASSLLPTPTSYPMNSASL